MHAGNRCDAHLDRIAECPGDELFVLRAIADLRIEPCHAFKAENEHSLNLCGQNGLVEQITVGHKAQGQAIGERLEVHVGAW